MTCGTHVHVRDQGVLSKPLALRYSVGNGLEKILRPRKAQPNDNNFTTRQSMQLPSPNPDALLTILASLEFAQASIFFRDVEECSHVVLLAHLFGRQAVVEYDRAALHGQR